MNIQQKMTFFALVILKTRGTNSAGSPLACSRAHARAYASRSLSLTVCSLLALLLLPVHADAQWRSTETFREVSLLTLYNTGEDRLLAAGRSGGVWHSLDQGDSWQRRDFGIDTESVIIAFASHEGVLFAFSFTGQIYRSTDAGLVWLPSSDLGEGATVLAALSYDDRLWLAGSQGLLHSSEGVIWSADNAGIAAGTVITALAVYEEALFAASGDRGVFRRDPQTGSWSALNDGLGDRRLLSLAASADELFAGSSGGGAFSLQPNPQFWRSRSMGMGAEEFVTSLTTYDVSVAAVTLDGGVFVWEPFLAVWNSVARGLPASLQATHIMAEGSQLFVAGDGPGLYRRDVSGVVLDVHSATTKAAAGWNINLNIDAAELVLRAPQELLGIGAAIELYLFDLRGRLVWKDGDAFMLSAQMHFQLPMNLPSQMYLLQVEFADKQVGTLRFVPSQPEK